jgi:hypothetical protein
VVHWIGLSLSFSKSTSLLKTESGCKSYDRLHLPSFSVGTNPVAPGFSPGGRFRAGGAGLYAGRSGTCTGATPETLPEHGSGAGPVLAGLCTGQSGAEPGETDFWPVFGRVLPPTALFRFAIKGASSPMVFYGF